MPDIDLVIVPIATVVAFVLSAVHYLVLGNGLGTAGGALVGGWA